MKNKKKFIYIFTYLYLVMFGFKTIVIAEGETFDCSYWGKTLQDFQYIFDFCKIVIPLLVIGLSTFDFIKAITGKDEKDMKKAFNKLLKRLALAVVFFFLPVILNFLLETLIGANAKICINT